MNSDLLLGLLGGVMVGISLAIIITGLFKRNEKYVEDCIEDAMQTLPDGIVLNLHIENGSSCIKLTDNHGNDLNYKDPVHHDLVDRFTLAQLDADDMGYVIRCNQVAGC